MARERLYQMYMFMMNLHEHYKWSCTSCPFWARSSSKLSMKLVFARTYVMIWWVCTRHFLCVAAFCSFEISVKKKNLCHTCHTCYSGKTPAVTRHLQSLDPTEEWCWVSRLVLQLRLRIHTGIVFFCGNTEESQPKPRKRKHGFGTKIARAGSECWISLNKQLNAGTRVWCLSRFRASFQVNLACLCACWSELWKLLKTERWQNRGARTHQTGCQLNPGQRWHCTQYGTVCSEYKPHRA
jgi:hypothetical protein